MSGIQTMSLVAAVAFVVTASVTGCALFKRGDHAEAQPVIDERSERRIVQIALEMLQPANSRYNPDKGKAYLEYALKRGAIKRIELPAPALLELLKSERVASEKSRSLEQQLEIMKEIDMKREESL